MNSTPKKMTRTERKHWGFGTDAMKMIEYDLMGYVSKTCAIPDDWHRIWEEQDKRDPKRQKVTVRLDANVVKFFKDLGPGHGERMNRVLAAFMHFRLAKLIDGPDTMDYVLRPDEVMARVEKRPEFGDMLAERAKAEQRVEEMRERLGK
ncbi:MAG: BrnA antitoxin family protein [Octadecabacter sp.]|nr:BrnA antitoxin family protein [Octadecabacter sp.]